MTGAITGGATWDENAYIVHEPKQNLEEEERFFKEIVKLKMSQCPESANLERFFFFDNLALHTAAGPAVRAAVKLSCPTETTR